MRLPPKAAFDRLEARLRDAVTGRVGRARRPSTLERIGDALGSDRMVPIYLAFVSGSLFSMVMAIIWARVIL